MNTPRIECETGTFRITLHNGDQWLLHVKPAVAPCAHFEVYKVHGDDSRAQWTMRRERACSAIVRHIALFSNDGNDQSFFDYLELEVSGIIAMVRYE